MKTRELNNRVIELGMAGKSAEATALLLKEAGPAVEAWQAAIRENLATQGTGNELAYKASIADYQSARAWLVGCALAGLAASLALVLLVVRSVIRQIGGAPAEVAALVQTIADADLRSIITVREGDSTSIVAAMAHMQASLSGIVNSVRGNSESVATASSQIAQGDHDLSQRTEEQASALQQTAATTDQLGTTVKHNADKAKQASQLAQGASQVAERGGAVVAQVVGTMKGINDSSKKIADIISVIDGIAFQTNGKRRRGRESARAGPATGADGAGLPIGTWPHAKCDRTEAGCTVQHCAAASKSSASGFCGPPGRAADCRPGNGAGSRWRR